MSKKGKRWMKRVGEGNRGRGIKRGKGERWKRERKEKEEISYKDLDVGQKREWRISRMKLKKDGERKRRKDNEWWRKKENILKMLSQGTMSREKLLV